MLDASLRRSGTKALRGPQTSRNHALFLNVRRECPHESNEKGNTASAACPRRRWNLNASALYTRQAAAFRNEMKQTCAALVGIVQGILADGQLHDREIIFLNNWLTKAESVSLLWPGSVIHAQVKQVLADGVVTSEERAHLTKTLEALIGGALDEQAEPAAVTSLAFDEVAEIEHRERAFCFTGDFVFGPRGICEKAVVLRGGCIAGVSTKLHYLVVGGLGSPEWKHGVFGTKIEKAMEHKQNGCALKILHEDRWAAAL